MKEGRLTYNGTFQFEAGGRLDSLEIVYHSSREKYTPGERVIWICHALTANSDVEDWWPELAGPGKTIDTGRDFVVCVNMLCSSYGSSGPATTDKTSGRPYFFDFPKTTIRDMVSACRYVREHLGIETIDLLIGSSIGGFQAIEWAITEPDRIRKLFLMATAPRISPWLGAMAEAQRMALEADVTFRQCQDIHGGTDGLKCARAQALISYRCFNGYGISQKEDDQNCLFAGKVASYERYQGEKLIRRGFDAYSYYYLCNALDSHNAGRGRGGVAAALGRITARTVAACIDTDMIFPPCEFKEWADMIPGVTKRTIHSEFGHDGFLLETAQIKEIITTMLNGKNATAA